MSDRLDFSVNLDDLAADAAAWAEGAESLGAIRRIVDGDCRLSGTVFSGGPDGDGASKRYEAFRLLVSDLLGGGEARFADIGDRVQRTRAVYGQADDIARMQPTATDIAGRRPEGERHGR